MNRVFGASRESLAPQLIFFPKKSSRSIFSSVNGGNSDNDILKIQYPVAWEFFLKSNIASLHQKAQKIDAQISANDVIVQMQDSYRRIADSRPVNARDEARIQWYINQLNADALSTLNSKTQDQLTRNQNYQQFVRNPFYGAMPLNPISSSKKSSAFYSPIGRTFV